MSNSTNNYTIYEGFELPSKGLIYDPPINPHIELRSMTARDEMKRLAPSNTPLKVLADIIDDCIIKRPNEQPSISVYDMCFGDYEFLLHKLRIITYGDEYKTLVQCPDCGEVIEAVAHLNDLSLKEYNEEEFKSLCNIVLPVSKKSVELIPMTPHLTEDIDAMVAQKKKKFKDASIDFNTLCKVICSIKSINGTSLGPLEIERQISELPAKDFQKLLLSIENLGKAIGLDNILALTCPKCGGEIKTFFRYGQEFFRPSTI